MTGPAALGDQRIIRSYGPLQLTDVVRYAGASGDFNPLHVDLHAAGAAGFDEIFVMGLLPASVLAGFAADIGGIENIRSFAVRYHKPVYLGETVECWGEVDNTAEGDPDQVHLILGCSTVRSGTVISGRASFVRSTRPREASNERS